MWESDRAVVRVEKPGCLERLVHLIAACFVCFILAAITVSFWPDKSEPTPPPAPPLPPQPELPLFSPEEAVKPLPGLRQYSVPPLKGERTWTSVSGDTSVGCFKSIEDDDTVHLILETGKEVVIPRARLSSTDRLFLVEYGL
jgi:hypothetical protein